MRVLSQISGSSGYSKSANTPRTLCPNRCQYFRWSFRVAFWTFIAQYASAHWSSGLHLFSMADSIRFSSSNSVMLSSSACRPFCSERISTARSYAPGIHNATNGLPSPFVSSETETWTPVLRRAGILFVITSLGLTALPQRSSLRPGLRVG